jgi:outer membrane receptor protein involved in Fe transport
MFESCPRYLCVVILGSFLALGGASLAWSQTQSINGTISGRVTDASGSAIPAAEVTVTNSGTGLTRTIETGADGLYTIPNLPLGTYTVAVKKTGFSTTTFANVVLNAGTNAVMNAALKVGTVTQTVEVTSGAPVLKTAQEDIGTTLDTRAITSLPLVSRNPYNFILFQPGVSGHPNPELGIPRTLNTNGQLDRINYQLDGMVDTESDRYGLRLFPISNAYVNQVQTVSNSFAPEFGNTIGDIYNVITDSGTNTLHGMFNFIYRPIGTVSRPFLTKPSQPKPDLTQQDYSGNLGGPILKNKLFFFGAYEHLRRGQPSPIAINPAQAAQIGLAPSLLATLPAVEHAQFLDLRMDYNINSENQMFVRYDYFRNEFPFNTGVGGLNAGDASTDFHDRAHIGGVQLVSAFGPNLANELRASDPYRKEVHVSGPTTGPGPQVVISGVATFNGTISNGSFFAEKVPSVNDNLTWILGAHTLKFGGSFQENVDVQQNAVFNQYTFSTIANYLAAQSGANPLAYSTFSSSIGDSRQAYRTKFWGLYGQDTWQVGPNLSMTYGLRWDQYRPPPANANAPMVFSRSFKTDNRDFAPRLGFAWKMDDNTVVRASGGLFFDAPPTNLWFNALFNDGSGRSFTAVLSPTTAGAPLFPGVPTSTTPPGNPDITTVTPTRHDSYALNASLQVQRQIGTNNSVTVGYVYTAGRQLEFLRNMNLINPTGTLADGRPVFSQTVSAATRLFPAFNNITLQDTGATSNYNALLLMFEHRWSHGIQLQANYTWSHTLSNAPDVNSFEINSPIQDPTNRSRDYGNSYVDRPNSLTINTVIQPTFSGGSGWGHALLNGNQFSILGNVSSGDTLNLLANRVLNGDATTGGVTRPLFVGRNTARGSNIYQFDIRYTRTLATFFERLQPQIFVEAQNVANHPNITGFNTTIPVTTAGVPVSGIPTVFPATSSVLEARILQYGVKVQF